MKSELPWVVVRTRNDMPLLRQTLLALGHQTQAHHLLVMENASTDGSREEAQAHGARIIHIPADAYVPGRVLNHAMQASDGEWVVFLNADTTPTGSRWLERLLQGGSSKPAVAAVFGRQVPRPDCHPLFARDTHATFGDGHQQARWRHCFSMAASAIRRSVWETRPFDERLAYSEDVAWTYRVRQSGFGVVYVPEALAVHSHNYSLEAWCRRQYGEGYAEASIFEWNAWQASWPRQVLLPYLRQLADDLPWCLSRRAWGAALEAPWLRGRAAWARWRGLRDGLRLIARDDVRGDSG